MVRDAHNKSRSLLHNERWSFDARSWSAPLLFSNRLTLLVAPRLLNQPLNSLNDFLASVARVSQDASGPSLLIC